MGTRRIRGALLWLLVFTLLVNGCAVRQKLPYEPDAANAAHLSEREACAELRKILAKVVEVTESGWQDMVVSNARPPKERRPPSYVVTPTRFSLARLESASAGEHAAVAIVQIVGVVVLAAILTIITFGLVLALGDAFRSPSLFGGGPGFQGAAPRRVLHRFRLARIHHAELWRLSRGGTEVRLFDRKGRASSLLLQRQGHAQRFADLVAYLATPRLKRPRPPAAWTLRNSTDLPLSVLCRLGGELQRKEIPPGETLTLTAPKPGTYGYTLRQGDRRVKGRVSLRPGKTARTVWE